jgi:hypothetical protein
LIVDVFVFKKREKNERRNPKKRKILSNKYSRRYGGRPSWSDPIENLTQSRGKKWAGLEC